MTAVESRLDQYGKAVRTAVEHLLATEPRYDGLYGMLRYHLGWLESNDGGPGKQLRPAICLLVAEAVGGDWRPAVPVATAVELLHNFSLIHDDIQDGSHMRRHREALWSVWGLAQGVNAGDALLILAEQAILEATPPMDPALALGSVRRLNAACRRLCEGQYLDLLWEDQPTIELDEYLEMIAGKTAALFRCAAELGAYSVGANPALQEAFALGLAFQAADDVLGVWGPADQTGKTSDLDVANRKKTLPVVIGLSAPDSPMANRLRELFAQDRQLTPDGTAEATAVLDQLGVRPEAERLARGFRDEAIGVIEAAGLGERSEPLLEFTRAVVPEM
ncbi:MAG: Geranylgeranyl pyrophosphate synthase [Chloroflexi bacterium]|nr:Geranylgeranyl pyrophosphate synthase [Chloroflexota bacterium]